MFVVGKSVTWVCDNCKGISDACEKCGQPVRQQVIRKDNFKTCAICFLKNFKKVEKQKVGIVSKHRTLGELQKDLEKVTVFRTNSAKAGMLRPFLYLVSLPPVQRLQIAINLGWTIIVEASFGDSHAESWDIISRKGLGLRDRMSRMRDTWLRCGCLLGVIHVCACVCVHACTVHVSVHVNLCAVYAVQVYQVCTYMHACDVYGMRLLMNQNAYMRGVLVYMYMCVCVCVCVFACAYAVHFYHAEKNLVMS
jgi:hypothetical protein